MFIVGRLEEAFDRLGGHPRAGRKGRAWAGRQLAVAQTPYVLYYSIRKSAVWIDRIIHGARKWPPSPDEDE
jgi:toxin ParE1/3/4